MKSELGISSVALAELMKDTLNKGALFRFQVKGFSMSPFIKDGDIVTIAPFFNSSLKFGWPVAFLNPKSGKLAIHRVVEKANGRFMIKGDNCPAIDGLVTKEEIFGYVKKIERDGKAVSLGIGSKKAVVALLSRAGFLPFIILLWNAVPYFARRPIKKRILDKTGNIDYTLYKR